MVERIDNSMYRTYIVVTGLVFIPDLSENILLVRRSNLSTVMPNFWEFPSGYLKKTESAEDAVLREVQEETGLITKICLTSDPMTIVDKNIRWIVLPFLLRSDSKRVILNPSEHSKFNWIKYQDVDRYCTVIGTLDILHMFKPFVVLERKKAAFSEAIRALKNFELCG